MRASRVAYHKNHAGALTERAAESHKSYYEHEYSNDDEERSRRKVARIQEMREVLVNSVDGRTDRYYHYSRQLRQK